MQFLFLPLSNEMLRAICWTLIHSLWQGALAAVLAGIIIISTRKTAARLRYNLLGNVMILFVFATVITFYFQRQGSTPVEEPAVSPGTIDPGALTLFTDQVPLPGTSMDFVDRVVAYFNVHADLFVLVWVVFCIVHCIRISTGLAGVRRMRRHKIHSSDNWQATLNLLSQKLGIRSSVRLLQSGLIKVPVAVGFFKPVILIPLGLLSHLPPEQVETILLHELAHIRRRDYLVNLLQCLAEAIFFFNPALLWISSLLRQEREACCDDIVVANTTHKGSYLEALVSFHEYAFVPSAYAMGIGGKRYYLLNRVKRMLTRENKKLNLMEKTLLLLGITAITAFTFIPQKEAAVVKNPVTVSQVVTETSPVSVLPPPAPVLVHQPRKKQTREPRQEQKPVPVMDTVPSPGKNSNNNSNSNSNSNYNELKFSGISSNVNDNGTTRTETTTLTDQYGKKYTITKLNNKVTTLTIDGKAVPGNEWSKHADLFRKIDGAVYRGKENEWKIKGEEWKLKGKEWEKLGKEKQKEIEDKIRQKEKQMKEREKEIEKRIKDREKQLKEKDKQIEDKMRQKEKEVEEKVKQVREKEKQIKEKNRQVREQERIKKDNQRKDGRKEIRKDTLRVSGVQNLKFEYASNLQMHLDNKLNLHIDVTKINYKPKFDVEPKLNVQSQIDFNLHLKTTPRPPATPKQLAAPARPPVYIQ